MAKITFIHPNANSETDFKGKKTTIPPEGLCLLAAIVREQGYEPNIIDAAALLLNNKEIIEILKKATTRFYRYNFNNRKYILNIQISR